MKTIFFLIFPVFVFSFAFFYATPSYAIVDPNGVPNNKFGVHVITGSDEEASEAADLVNSSGGDWGYITFLIQRNQMQKDRWQNYFNYLREKHLIPIVRIATEPDGNAWKKPEDGDAQKWADFLDSLNWPATNRYVIIYNEPNQGHEWAGQVNAAEYAKELSSTIDALKAKTSDFFVLNAGFDASAPQQPPNFYDEAEFLKEMNQAVPGIFNKLDGWDSHSYPNPGFIGSPNDKGRGTIMTWQWELDTLKGLGLTKNLPVFITETGWKHAEGVNYESADPSADTVADYYKQSFANAWSSSQIVAVTPFVLDYQYPPFDHFSFKKLTGGSKNQFVLGISYPAFYPDYQAIVDIGKIAGRPAQVQTGRLVEGSIYASIVLNKDYVIILVFKNTGQSIWDDTGPLMLKVIKSDPSLGLGGAFITDGKKIEPGGQAVFHVHFKPTKLGTYGIAFQLDNGSMNVQTDPISFTTEVKSPAVLMVKANLIGSPDSSGNYLLLANSDIIKVGDTIYLNEAGQSAQIEAKSLLPDQEYEFTLEGPDYQPKTIKAFIKDGINTLDFGDLQPDLAYTIFHPKIILYKLGLICQNQTSC